MSKPKHNLTPMQRRAMRCTAAGLTHAECASLLGLTRVAFSLRLHRARKRRGERREPNPRPRKITQLSACGEV